MNSTTFGTILLSLMMAGLLVGGVAIPLITDATTETTTVTNENPQWIRMAYLTDQSDYQVSYAIANDTITITNGEDTQSGAVTDTILYADDKTAIMVSGDDVILIGEASGVTGYKYLEWPIIVERSNGELSVTDANDTDTFVDVREWCYVPLSTEKYGVFSTGNLNRYGGALAVAGAYAGVYCYNDYVTEDVGLVMDADYTEDYITSVKWALESNNAKSKTVIPLVKEEKIIDPDSLVTVKSAPPTPTYTDGDWGYDLNGSNAIIVSYSGATGGVLTVPATVGGYNVVAVGKGVSNAPVVDTSSTFTGLTISDGITKINARAFTGCSGIIGTLTIPDSVTEIGSLAFYGCGFTGTLTIPDSVTTIGNGAFSDCIGFTGTLVLPDTITSWGGSVFTKCSGFTSLELPDNLTTVTQSMFSDCTGLTGALVIPDSVTTISTSAFVGCTGLTGALVIPDSVTTIGIAAFENCSGFTGALVIPDSVTTIGSEAFRNCTGITGLVNLSSAVPVETSGIYYGSFLDSGITEVLNLSDVEYTTTSYGLNAESVQDHIDAESYLCITEVSETTQKEGAVYDVFLVLPVVMIAGVVLVGVYLLIRRF